jgi:2-C-methyl-D-erythritol 4-phosphate cytidylyltransferase
MMATTAVTDVPQRAARRYALIPCGGTGSRAGAGLPKQYRMIAGQSVLAHTLAAFARVPQLSAVVVAVAPDDAAGVHLATQALPPENATFSIAECAGATRAITVFNALEWLLQHGALPHDWVLVHDAARCLVTPAQIERLVQACAGDAVGGLLAHRLPDTLKQAREGRAVATIDRADKWLAQTPQMFRIGRLREALLAAGDTVTDEASAIESLGLQPLLVAGSAENFKLTYPEDFALAQAVLQSRTPCARD